MNIGVAADLAQHAGAGRRDVVSNATSPFPITSSTSDRYLELKAIFDSPSAASTLASISPWFSPTSSARDDMRNLPSSSPRYLEPYYPASVSGKDCGSPSRTQELFLVNDDPRLMLLGNKLRVVGECPLN